MMATISEGQWGKIRDMLSREPLTTLELEGMLRRQGSPCPDDLARTLNVLRRKGLVYGALSRERGAWIWWVEEQSP